MSSTRWSGDWGCCSSTVPHTSRPWLYERKLEVMVFGGVDYLLVVHRLKKVGNHLPMVKIGCSGFELFTFQFLRFYVPVLFCVNYCNRFMQQRTFICLPDLIFSLRTVHILVIERTFWVSDFALSILCIVKLVHIVVIAFSCISSVPFSSIQFFT